MKFKLSIIGVLIFCTFAQAEILQKFYAGALYFGTAPNTYNIDQSISTMVGIKNKFNLANWGSINTRIRTDFNTSVGQFWYQKQFGQFDFSIGRVSRPVKRLNCSEPISADSHFEPPSKAVIPSSTTGILGVYHSVLGGVYQDKNGNLEYGFGASQTINWFIFKKVSVSGYKLDRKSNTGGVALNLEMVRFSSVFFAQQDLNSERIFSNASYLELPHQSGIFTSLVNRQNKWEQIEAGFIKYLTDSLPLVKMNYLVGASYFYSETKPKAVHLFLQVYFQQ